jgi:hypothetical protein
MAETLVQYKDHGVKELTDTTFEHLTQVSRYRYSKKRKIPVLRIRNYFFRIRILGSIILNKGA